MGLPPKVIHAYTTPHGSAPAYVNLQAHEVTGAEELFTLIVRSAPADNGHTARITLTREELTDLVCKAARHLTGVDLPVPTCDVPPPGWACTRARGHDGPCAAIPTTGGDHG